MPCRPHLGALWWQSAMVVMHVRERAIAAFNGGRSALKGTHALASPCLPLLESLEGKPLGEPVGVKRCLTQLQGLAQFGFPPGTTGVRHLMGPIDAWQEALPGPYPPACRPCCGRSILRHTCPPEVYEGRHG